MKITLDNQAMELGWGGMAIMAVPMVLFLLYLLFLAPKLYAFPQKYIEKKYAVKLIFRWRYFTVQGNVSDFQKFWIGLYYLFLLFVLMFTPVLLLALLTFYLQDFIVLRKI